MNKQKKFKKGFIYGIVFSILLEIIMRLTGNYQELGWKNLCMMLLIGLFYGLMALTKWDKYFMDEKYLKEE